MTVLSLRTVEQVKPKPTKKSGLTTIWPLPTD